MQTVEPIEKNLLETKNREQWNEPIRLVERRRNAPKWSTTI